MKKVIEKKEYKCGTCNKIFSTYNNLNTHIKSAQYCIKQRESQENDQKEYKCEYCEKTFTREGYLQVHTGNCSKKIELECKKHIDEVNNVHKEEFESLISFHDEELQSIKDAHDEELQTIKDAYSKELQLMKNSHNKELQSIKNVHYKGLQAVEKQLKMLENDKNKKIHKLKLKNQSYAEKIKELEDRLQSTTSAKDVNQGVIQGMEKIKPGSTTVIKKCTINIKLNNISIANIPALTIEYIRANLGKYDYEKYKRGDVGLIDFLAELMILEDDRNYACTDVSRNKFYILGLDEENLKEWKVDGKAKILKIIFHELYSTINGHYEKMLDEQLKGDDTLKQIYTEKMAKLDPMRKAIMFREEIDKYIETIIKKLGSLVGV
jgi:uncharacterized CHY-type Zn-finger protein/vacuolar-type H+-ATPase subunit E/Vma4